VCLLAPSSALKWAKEYKIKKEKKKKKKKIIV